MARSGGRSPLHLCETPSRNTGPRRKARGPSPPVRLWRFPGAIRVLIIVGSSAIFWILIIWALR
jgi:hypothetical protein